jgi:periplasmic protein TonB
MHEVPRNTSAARAVPSAHSGGTQLRGGDRPVLGHSVLGEQNRRLGGAFGLSLVSHVVAVVLVLFIASRIPQAQYEPFVPVQNYEIVWLPQEGPGGGGGGGGSETPEPPQKVELPGEDRISVPVAKPPPVQPTPPPPAEEPAPAEQEMNIPALTMGAAEQTIAGVLEGLPSATLSQGPGSGGGAGSGRGTGMGEGEGSGLGPGTGGGAGGGVYRPGSGIQEPRILREVKPQYTADAMRAKVQGIVLVECVVLPDGTVGDARITRSLDPVFGLDHEALKAVKQWRFVPGMRAGQPVPVLVSIELTFTLR